MNKYYANFGRRVQKLLWNSHQNLYWDFYWLTSDLENWVTNVGEKFADNAKLGLTKWRQVKLEQSTRKYGVRQWQNIQWKPTESHAAGHTNSSCIIWWLAQQEAGLTSDLGYCKSECLKLVSSSTHPPPHFCQSKQAPLFLSDDRWLVTFLSSQHCTDLGQSTKRVIKVAKPAGGNS